MRYGIDTQKRKYLMSNLSGVTVTDQPVGVYIEVLTCLQYLTSLNHMYKGTTVHDNTC